MVKPFIIKASVCGASHLHNGLPNQDAIAYYQADNSEMLIVAVADGHGGKKYTHSDRGAKFAVSAAIEVLSETFKDVQTLTLSQIKRCAEDVIPQAIVRCWQHKIDEYYNLQAALKEPNKYLYFGTTLLVSMVLPQCVVYWQLGDGDMMVLQADNNIDKPIPVDSRLLGNETTSLSGKHAWFDFRCCFQPLLNNTPPRLIMLATDGYSNSFVDDAGFTQAVIDIAELVESQGSEWIQAQLPDWLNQASAQGSGDDISVGLIYFPR